MPSAAPATFSLALVRGGPPQEVQAPWPPQEEEQALSLVDASLRDRLGPQVYWPPGQGRQALL